MKKQLLAFSFLIAGASMVAQTPRLSLVEEFTGENCPPCAAYNPAFNALLSQPQNTANVVPLKWQVPIPSAPTATWSLYQTNKTEINYRYSSYGYGINSAPSVRIDGQMPTVFGAGGENITQQNSQVFATAQSYTSAFSVTLNRAWDLTYSSINVTVNIVGSASFTPVGALKFRLVMTEELIQFATPPGSNGETTFENVAVRSFPTPSGIQNGTALTAGTWTLGQSQSFVINCPVPSYVRDKSEIAFVGFIQDDGDRRVAQAVRASKDPIPNDAKAISATLPAYFICGSSTTPQMLIKNNGSNAITALTITPIVDQIPSSNVTTWTGNLAVGASTNLVLNPITAAGGGHVLDLNISGVSGVDFNLLNNTSNTSFYLSTGYTSTPVAEGFVSTAFPPVLWGLKNTDGGASWSQNNLRGAFGLSTNSAKYDFYSNSVTGDADDLFLPPMDLSGTMTPSLTFDVAYRQYNAASSDKLEVFVSDDCGVTWTSKYSKAGPTLSTFAGYQTGAFLPLQDSAYWRHETIALPGYAYATLLVKFRATSAYGNNLYLDNVNLQQEQPIVEPPVTTGIVTTNNNNLSVGLYPNPSNGETNLKIATAKPTSVKITVMNILGQSVYTQAANLSAGSNNISLNVSEFAAGVYNVMIESNTGTTVKKLNVTK